VSILGSWLVLTVSFWLTSAVLPGFHVKGLGGALRVAALFGLLNWAIGWLIFGFIGVVTLGLGFLLIFVTRIIVNAIVLKITDTFSQSLTIDGFGHALLGALLMSAVGTVAEVLMRLL
jgi:putative membrane protein